MKDFLTRLDPEDCAKLERLGEHVRLGPREHLFRRGDPGGDMYRVDEGTLDAVDRRSRPEVVLDVMVPGDVVGELAFIDGCPRSVDVVANTACRLTRWPAVALGALLDSDSVFALHLWRALAEEVTERVRFLTFNAVTGGLRSSTATRPPGDAEGDEEVEGPVREIRDGLAEADRRLRRDPTDPEATASVEELLARLSSVARAFDERCRSPEVRSRLVQSVCRDLHPYLLRATTAHLCLSRPEGFAGGTGLHAHLAAHAPRGEGPLAVAVDAWLLNQPRAVGIRSRGERAADILEEALSSSRGGPIRALLAHTAHTAIPSRLRSLLVGREGGITVVEPSREALALQDTLLAGLGPALRIRLVQDHLADVAAVGALRAVQGQDLVVLQGLLDYLPARPAAQTLQHLCGHLGPGGRLIATALAPAADDALWRLLLDWPVVAREARSLVSLLEATGYANVEVQAAGGAGLVVEARVL